jgi:diguanylate cyclase (GGDEF)-like protein
MQLTTARASSVQHLAARPRLTRPLALWSLVGITAIVFALDRMTGLPHVQHLYYFPIILGAVAFGRTSGLVTATLAIVLYHLANPHALTWQYEESDVLQIGVFLAVGLVSAKLADDARRLHGLAMTDDLTGLHNLRSFEIELKTQMQSARRTGTAISLLVIDVDRLKSLNDEHGHLAGAEAVRTVGGIIARQIPPDAVACRYGGDEFVVALPECASVEARRVADELRRAVRACGPVLAGRPFPGRTLSISIGLASRSFNDGDESSDAMGGDDEESEALFRAADAALYTAKHGGRNRVHAAPLGHSPVRHRSADRRAGGAGG